MTTNPQRGSEPWGLLGNPYSYALNTRDLLTLSQGAASDAGLPAVAYEIRTANLIAAAAAGLIDDDGSISSRLGRESN